CRGRRRTRCLHASLGDQPRHPADAVPQHGTDVVEPHPGRRRRPPRRVRCCGRSTHFARLARMNLTGQVALVTGAGSPDGIGFACRKSLAADGAHVVIASTTDRINDRVAELESMGCSATGFVGDLMVDGVAASLVDATLAVAGRVDICVNNAGMIALGISPRSRTPAGVSADAWADSLHRNLTTCFTVTQACLPPMRERGYGRIVNIAS